MCACVSLVCLRVNLRVSTCILCVLISMVLGCFCVFVYPGLRGVHMYLNMCMCVCMFVFDCLRTFLPHAPVCVRVLAHACTEKWV